MIATRPVATAAMIGLLLAAPAAAQKPAEARWAGEWTGSYLCAQGETGLTLRLRPRGDGTLDGLFHFWPLPWNRSAAEGCFEMQARPVAGEPPGLSLIARRWLLRPSGYVTVDLDGALTEEGTLRGLVGGPGCTGFELARAASPRPLPAACAGPLALR